MHLTYVIDDHNEVADGKLVRERADIVMEVLRNPHILRPVGEWIGGEMTRQSMS